MTATATAAKTVRRTKLPPRTGASSTRRPSRLAPWLFALLFAALGGFFLSGGLPTDVAAPPDLSLASACSAVDPASLPADESPRYVTQKIRDIEVGTWVLADNPEQEDAEDEYGRIDPAQWRKIALRMEKPDGGTLDIDFLRPLSWLEAEEARLGGSVYLSMEELGIDGPAEVLSITSCPPLPDRPSDGHHLVTGKFAHSAANVIDLHIEGLDEPIGTTANHPFWSDDRQEFVKAGSLQVGEHVLSLDGTPSPVTSLRPRTGTEPVFNLEVETEHVYYVSHLGVLVHTTCEGAHHLVPMGLGSKIRRGDPILTDMNQFRHTNIHTRMAEHLDDYKKGGITMNPQRWGTERVCKTFTKEERYEAMYQFYINYNNGEYFARFLSEFAETLRRGAFE